MRRLKPSRRGLGEEEGPDEDASGEDDGDRAPVSGSRARRSGGLGPDPFARLTATARSRSNGRVAGGGSTVVSAAEEDSVAPEDEGGGADGGGGGSGGFPQLNAEGGFPEVNPDDGSGGGALDLPASTAPSLSRVFAAAPTAAWWEKAPGGSASVCAIVRTYVGQRAALPALLSSLLASGHPGLTLILADTGSGAPFGADLRWD
jgi:hypothetical protein